MPQRRNLLTQPTQPTPPAQLAQQPVTSTQAPRPPTSPSPRSPAQPGTPNLLGMLDQFRSQFPGGSSNLLDPQINARADDRFTQILRAAGGDPTGLKQEIGPVRFGDRLRETLFRPDTLNQSGIIQIGNGLALNVRTGQVTPVGQASSGPISQAISAAAAPQRVQSTGFQPPSSTTQGVTEFDFNFSPTQLSLLQGAGASGQQIQGLLDAVVRDITASQDTQRRGPVEAGDQTNNPVAFARQKRKALKEGLSEQQAIARANRIVNDEPSRFGESTSDAVQFQLERFGTDDFIRRQLLAGLEGRGPLAGIGTAGGGGGGFGGGGGGPNLPPVGNTPPDPFPVDRDPNLDPNNFDPSQGAPPPPGVDFGNSPFSQLIESGIAGLIESGGAAPSAFGQDARTALGSQLTALGQRQTTGRSADVDAAISDLLSGGRDIGNFIDDRVINRNVESLTEALDRQREAQTSGLEARLASRGLIGSGPQRSGLAGIERDIASRFATGLRNIGTDELARSRGTFEEALRLGEAGRQADLGATNDLLGQALGAGQADTNTFLEAISQGTQRQGILSDVALNMAGLNQRASEFAAQFGLQREQVLEQLMLQRLSALLPAIQNLFTGAGTAQRGAV